MRVLWVVNLMLPAFAASQGRAASVREGWLSGLYSAVRCAQSAPGELTLGIAYPLSGDGGIVPRAEWDGAVWYGFVEDLTHPERYDPGLEDAFEEILADFEPDLVHVFGTEFPHALACLRALNDPPRALVGIQGYCGGIAEAYMAGLPEQVQRSATFRDRIRHDSLMKQQEKFRQRAEYERELLMLADHVTGRTDYDREAAETLHPGCSYHPMNETLRSTFYTGEWSASGAAAHRIFLTQGDYPLKGFHWLLEALAMLTSDYPDSTLVVAGKSVIGHDGRHVPLFLRIGAYGKYLRRLIGRKHLERRVTMLGELTADEMKRELLSSSVFVIPSAVENSPNSMGEAMLLGMPVVASRTGGIPSLLTENREGLLVSVGDVEELSRAIRQIWEEPVITSVYGENARKRALVTHDPETNHRRLFEIYREVCSGSVTEQTQESAG